MDELQHNDNPIWTETAGEKHADAQIGGVLDRSELELFIPALVGLRLARFCVSHKQKAHRVHLLGPLRSLSG